MKIGLIGCGNMAKAIIEGVIAADLFKKEDIYASALNTQKLTDYCNAVSIRTSSNLEILQKCDIIILAVKPQKFDEILPEISNFVSDKLVISIAAGKTISFISDYLKQTKIIRIMPNLNAAVKCSVSALCANALCSTKDIALAKKIFESIGKVYEIEEENFSAFSAAACCSPAFTFMYIDALAKGAIACGLDAKTAYSAATDAVKGSAVMLEKSADTAERLVEKVCSPGGTTIEGVNVLNKNGFEDIIKKAVNASYEKDKQL